MLVVPNISCDFGSDHRSQMFCSISVEILDMNFTQVKIEVYKHILTIAAVINQLFDLLSTIKLMRRLDKRLISLSNSFWRKGSKLSDSSSLNVNISWFLSSSVTVN